MKLAARLTLLASTALFCTASPVSAAEPATPRMTANVAASANSAPNQLDLSALRANARQRARDFAYAAAFATLDLSQVKQDIATVMTTSQDWWPADYGTYGPLFIRMAWHSAGTYRVGDGRGGAGAGQQRFEPLNSWPDNANLDKARRLLWPVKQKYGEAISWADLMVLAGNVALETMGFKTFGFAGGRLDAPEPEAVDWGPEAEALGDQRHSAGRVLQGNLGATQMGLIYVNPEGPNGNPDPLAAAKDIRTTFGRMAMNDEETVALIAGGHTFGKTHGAAAKSCIAPEPLRAGVEEQGLGWKNRCGSGAGADTTTSGLEGAWTASPAQWSHQYLAFLWNFDWKQTRSPAGAIQWIPTEASAAGLVPDAHRANVRHAPVMLTTDLALKMDPAYREISKRFLDNPEQLEAAFARAWFKLTHRDMGPRARYLGPDVPGEALAWQDPVPAFTDPVVNKADVKALKAAVLASGLTTPELVRSAWASASSYRDTDRRGGADGARIRLAPQKDWAVNDPAELEKVLARLEQIRTDFNTRSKKRRISMADMIVLAGAAAVEKAAQAAGVDVEVPFRPGRGDAAAEQTDAASFAVLEPRADAFRNFAAPGAQNSAAQMLERADLLGLTIPEMTVLIGGLRALGANTGPSKHGVLTDTPGVLSNDFFRNLLDNGVAWRKAAEPGVYEGQLRKSGAVKWTATEVDLVFGANAELRAAAEPYAFDGSQAKAAFVKDFVAAWARVMDAGRFDLG